MAQEGAAVERVTEMSDELLHAVRRLYPQLTDAPVPEPPAVAAVIDGGARIVVARIEGRVVGMGTLVITTVLTGCTAHVEDVVVDTGARGRGIGERLMQELVTLAREEGADEVRLTSRPAREAANRLYRRLGFETGRTNHYALDLGTP